MGHATEVGRWAHARRGFYDALTTDPRCAHEMLALIGTRYDVERQGKENKLDVSAIKELQRQHSKPILDARLLSICRVSSREQSEGYSLQAQDQANREWAERQGHQIGQSIQCVETASQQKERRRFREIIDKVLQDRSVDGLVFHKVDRACRNLADPAVLEKLETEQGKRLFFSSQEFPQNAAGRLGVGVMGVVARWYTDNLKEEINKGFRSKIEAGEYPHKPPYGYRMGVSTNSNKLPVPDPDKAEIVRTAFGLMS